MGSGYQVQSWADQAPQQKLIKNKSIKITSGIAAGAGMYVLVIVAGLVMIGMLAPMKFKTLGNRNAPAVLFFHARVGDGMMKMQIVKIGFGGKQ